MLDECLEYLDGIKNVPDFKYEVIVVSDGSRDKTVSVAKKYTDKYGSEKVRVLDLIENRGKGGAVRLVRFFFQNLYHKILYNKYDHLCD